MTAPDRGGGLPRRNPPTTVSPTPRERTEEAPSLAGTGPLRRFGAYRTAVDERQRNGAGTHLPHPGAAFQHLPEDRRIPGTLCHRPGRAGGSATRALFAHNLPRSRRRSDPSVQESGHSACGGTGAGPPRTGHMPRLGGAVGNAAVRATTCRTAAPGGPGRCQPTECPVRRTGTSRPRDADGDPHAGSPAVAGGSAAAAGRTSCRVAAGALTCRRRRRRRTPDRTLPPVPATSPASPVPR